MRAKAPPSIVYKYLVFLEEYDRIVGFGTTQHAEPDCYGAFTPALRSQLLHSDEKTEWRMISADQQQEPFNEWTTDEDVERSMMDEVRQQAGTDRVVFQVGYVKTIKKRVNSDHRQNLYKNRDRFAHDKFRFNKLGDLVKRGKGLNKYDIKWMQAENQALLPEAERVAPQPAPPASPQPASRAGVPRAIQPRAIQPRAIQLRAGLPIQQAVAVQNIVQDVASRAAVPFLAPTSPRRNFWTAFAARTTVWQSCW
jgi:hypothetical protein